MSNRAYKKLASQINNNFEICDKSDDILNANQGTTFDRIYMLSEEDEKIIECNTDIVNLCKKSKRKSKRKAHKIPSLLPQLEQNNSCSSNNLSNCLDVNIKKLNANQEFESFLLTSLNSNKKKLVKNKQVTRLITPDPNWPNMTKLGLSMSELCVSDQNDIFCNKVANQSPISVIYKFEHNAKYRMLQLHFLQNLETNDPSQLMDIFSTQPYHVDTLLQLSLIYRLRGDFDQSAKFIELALHAMEQCFHPKFKLTDRAFCVLPYAFQNNRCFHIALFNHILNLNASMLTCTALENAKLLLNLDNSDPLAIILFIDYLALKCENYTFLIQFYLQYNDTYHFDLQYPNILYSVTLAAKLFALQISSKQAKNEIQTKNNSYNDENKSIKKDFSAFKTHILPPLNDWAKNRYNDISYNGMKKMLEYLEFFAEYMLYTSVTKYPSFLFQLLSYHQIVPQEYISAFKMYHKKHGKINKTNNDDKNINDIENCQNQAKIAQNIYEYLNHADKNLKPTSLMYKLQKHYVHMCGAYWNNFIQETPPISRNKNIKRRGNNLQQFSSKSIKRDESNSRNQQQQEKKQENSDIFDWIFDSLLKTFTIYYTNDAFVTENMPTSNLVSGSFYTSSCENKPKNLENSPRNCSVVKAFECTPLSYYRHFLYLYHFYSAREENNLAPTNAMEYKITPILPIENEIFTQTHMNETTLMRFHDPFPNINGLTFENTNTTLHEQITQHTLINYPYSSVVVDSSAINSDNNLNNPPRTQNSEPLSLTEFGRLIGSFFTTLIPPLPERILTNARNLRPNSNVDVINQINQENRIIDNIDNNNNSNRLNNSNPEGEITVLESGFSDYSNVQNTNSMQSNGNNTINGANIANRNIDNINNLNIDLIGEGFNNSRRR